MLVAIEEAGQTWAAGFVASKLVENAKISVNGKQVHNPFHLICAMLGPS